MRGKKENTEKMLLAVLVMHLFKKNEEKKNLAKYNF